ncbi:META domain-containing protein [Dyadobacter arcticus]|uniref:ABC-type dipeptide/oligopeptide/nickel transport system ATPase component n=1 Tax=Dyadobacter arcticus TaxID=1078754 RepID=A0ABX0UHT7_9BACT|nr:META domain-containing protein [Dyadobacter arcticus]NIJ51265.1 ABC-type dipeptide/oligopeptide/nickel transport system ATPase component [Dyadobacter arcticus]
MKTFILPALCLTFLIYLSGCGKTTTISSNMELTGKWELERIVQSNVTIKKPTLAKGQMEVSLIFKDKGELEGTSSRNYLTGFYETAQQNTIQIGGGGTERAETSWGNMFVNALPNVNLYDLKADKLILYYENNNQLIFAREQ